MAKGKHNMASAKSNTTSVYFTNSANSKHGVKKEVLSFTRVDACLIVFSLATLFIDILTDSILVATYFMNGQTFWGSCTLALIIIPAIIMQGFSLRWYMLDGTSGKGLCIAHVCLLGVFLRHLGVLRKGQEARRSGEVTDFQLYFHQHSDVCMLHLFEAFMESAPQLVLQIYIGIQMQHWNVWTGVSVAASMLSLTWAVSSYSRVMRRVRPEKQHVSLGGLALQAIWRVGMMAARISALVLFAICCQAWLFLLLGLHWLGMTVWVVLQKNDPNSTSVEEYAYNAVVGIVYCFCFFNLREGRARARMLAFYVVTVAQNLACLYLFLALKQHTYPFLAQFSAVTIVCGTVVGLGAMLFYYRFYHPSGPITLFGPQTAAETQTRVIQNNEIARPPRPPSPPQTVPPPQSTQNDPEKTNSLRSLKHLWTVDRDGSLSSRSDDMPLHGGSPQSDDGCTDKRLLLSCRTAPRQPIPSFSVTLPPCTSEPITQSTIEAPPSPQKLRTTINIEDSQISWNCPSLMEDTQSSDAIDCHVPAPVTSPVTSPATIPATEPESSLNKRRGICSSVELGLDKIDAEDTAKEEPSFSVLCQKLVNAAKVKQLAPIENRADKVKNVEKRESDYIDSKQSEIQSSDGTPSEVLSAHDYENICAVNIARETWGLRSWRGYSDIETWLHDDSVVRDRRRDTIVSLATMVSGASSERSTASESPPPARQQWEPVPPLPNRRPRPSYNRMDDYLDTLAYDLAEIEQRESNVFVAQPYVVDQNGMLYPMPPSQLDTIMEELEESSCTSTASVPISPAWASSLVATIDEIRTGTNNFDDTMTVSENDFDIGSYHSLQFDTSVDQSMRFSYSLPSLLQASRSWSQLTPEKLVEQELTSTPEKDRSLAGEEVSIKRGSNRPRRKTSLLREKFDKPIESKESVLKPDVFVSCDDPDDGQVIDKRQVVKPLNPEILASFNFPGGPQVPPLKTTGNRLVAIPVKPEVFASSDIPGGSHILSNRQVVKPVKPEVFVSSDIPGGSGVLSDRQVVKPIKPEVLVSSDVPGGNQVPSNRRVVKSVKPQVFVSSDIPSWIQAPILKSSGNRQVPLVKPVKPEVFVSSDIASGSQVPSLKTPRNRQWNSYTKMENQCNALESPVKQDKPRVDPFCRPRGKSVLKRVLTPPRLHNQKRTLVIASNASA